jgi:hypothetical protein
MNWDGAKAGGNTTTSKSSAFLAAGARASGRSIYRCGESDINTARNGISRPSLGSKELNRGIVTRDTVPSFCRPPELEKAQLTNLKADPARVSVRGAGIANAASEII